MITFLRNRKKIVLGLLSSAIVYVAAEVGLEIDEGTSAGIAALAFAAVAERSKPVFGRDVNSPTVDASGVVTVEASDQEQPAVRRRH